MRIDLTAAARIVPLTALMLGACASQSAYEKLERSFRRRVPERQRRKPEIANLQERAPAEPQHRNREPSARRRDL